MAAELLERRAEGREVEVDAADAGLLEFLDARRGRLARPAARRPPSSWISSVRVAAGRGRQTRKIVLLAADLSLMCRLTLRPRC